MRGRFGLVSLALLALAAGCGGNGGGGTARLSAVEPLPKPAAPAWIEEIAPQGTVKPDAQIRVIFKTPVLPVSALDTPQERAVLRHFTIAPAISGTFLMLTPRMIGFASNSGLPAATRVRVTVTRGLRDLAGDTLDRDIAWTFNTTPLTVQAAPNGDPYATPPPVVGLQPAVSIVSNARVDTASLAQNSAFTAGSQRVGAVVATPSASPDPQSSPVYELRPSQPLAKATHYTLQVGTGVLPATGNMPLAKPLRVSLTTYAPLKFSGAVPTADPRVSGPNARFAGGDPALVFNNPIATDGFSSHVHLKPAPQTSSPAFALSDDGNAIDVNPYALKPNSSYRVTIDAGLTDAFGQQLGHDVDVPLRTPNLAPYFWAPSGKATFISSQNLALQYSAIDLPQNAYRAAYRVLDPSYLAVHDVGYSGDPLPPVQSWQRYSIAGARRNQASSIDVPLRDRLGGPAGVLAYGATASIHGMTPYYGAVALTNIGLFSQWFPASGTVMVQRLSDGAPLAGASVAVYISNAYGENAVAPSGPCATGTADANGVWKAGADDVARCYAGNRPADQAPELLVTARNGADWAYVRVGSYSGIYEYATGDVDGTWSNGQPVSRGTIFSDRQMYQPGERGWFTTEAYVLQNGALRADRGVRYHLELADPNGKKTALPDRVTDTYARFSFPIDFSKTQALGYYTLTATSPEGAQITGSFRVAQFRPPNFSVDLSLDRQNVAAGSVATATVQGRYLFGAAMAGAKATFHVTRSSTTPAPKGWDDYTFGRQWFWPEEQPDVSSDVSQQTVTLDAQGRAQTAVPVPSDVPFAMTYTVDVDATDASNTTSSATGSFTALPSVKLIGVRTGFVGMMNQPLPIDVAVVDPQGHAISGERVHVELQKTIYSSVTQLMEGGEAARNQVRYQTVASGDVTSGSDAAHLSVKAGTPGVYRVRANFAGAPSDTTATDTQLWVSGPGMASLGQQNLSELQLKLDKPSYNAGATANLAVASPYSRADLYLRVVRDRVLYSTVVHVNGAVPAIRIPVTAAMFPNAAVEGILVRRGPPISGKDAHGVDSLVRIGVVPLKLGVNGRYARAAITVSSPTLEPQARQTVHLTLRDVQGRPVRGSFTVIVADDAVLRLSGYRPPDLVKVVYAAQPIAARFADNRPNVTLAQPSDTSPKGWGYGGGFLAGAAGTRLRTEFIPLAYFAGSVPTDAQGNARVTFSVPDNLTTWRIMAVATSAENQPRFAGADATFVTTKPLITQPLLPPFARPGDRFDAGLTVFNGGTSAFTAQTAGTLDGALAFEQQNERTLQAQQQFGPGLNAWRFPMIAGNGTTAHVAFRTQAGDRTDGFSVPLPIENTDVTESVFTSGAARGTQRIPLQIGREDARVQLQLAASLLPAVSEPAQKAFTGEGAPLVWEAAARVSIAGSMQMLGKPIGSPGAQAIAALHGLQRGDGGFGAWPHASSSDPDGTAQAVEALALAQRAGLPVPASALANAKPYLVRVLADPAGSAKWCTDTQCKNSMRLEMLQALAALGDRRTDFLSAIYGARETLDAADRAALALYLQQTPGWQTQAGALASQLASSAYRTARYANAPSQAAFLRLQAARGASQADLDDALRALLAQQCNCGWLSDEDTADALRAVVAYAKRQPSGSVKATVTLDGRTIASAEFATADAPMKTVTLPKLAAGSHTVDVRARGAGTLHYALDYRYSLGTGAPGRIAGLRVVREIRAANQPNVLARVDLAAAKPLQFAPGAVYDVELEVMTDHPVDRVRIVDPLPAGFEAVDTSFATSSTYYQPLASDWQIDYQQIARDRIFAFAQHLDPGVYALHYLVRSVTPGDFAWPGATAALVQAPEQFGRTAFTRATIK